MRLTSLSLLAILLVAPGYGVEREDSPGAGPFSGSTPVDPLELASQDPQEPEEEPEQEPFPDELIITPIVHGSFMLEHMGQVIHVDPWGRGDYSEAPLADIILITDIHPDHFDLETAASLMGAETTVVAPEVVADRWGGVDVVLANDKQTMVGDVFVEAVPMYNIERGPAPGQLYHDPERGNGYVINFGGKRIYISGDTECIPEMKELQDIDIAFVCMNLPYTMTPGEAAGCVKDFKPKVVYPYHYRGSDLDVFTFYLQDTPEVEIRILDWYPR